MKLLFSIRFKKSFAKIKDNSLRHRILSLIKQISQKPDKGKPLRYKLKEYKSIRVPPFRILYRVDGETLIINCLEHRKDVYK